MCGVTMDGVLTPAAVLFLFVLVADVNSNLPILGHYFP